MADLELIDAWRMWIAGQPVDTGTLWGWPILYWGRAGKIAAFLGGLTVILDLAGPDRLREAGVHLRRLVWRKRGDPPVRRATDWLLGCALFGAAFALTVLFVEPLVDDLTELPQLLQEIVLFVTFFVGVVVLTLLCTALALAMERVLNSTTPGYALRLIAVTLIVVGFHFDLLAS
jgi:hypothetical protein